MCGCCRRRARLLWDGAPLLHIGAPCLGAIAAVSWWGAACLRGSAVVPLAGRCAIAGCDIGAIVWWVWCLGAMFGCYIGWVARLDAFCLPCQGVTFRCSKTKNRLCYLGSMLQRNFSEFGVSPGVQFSTCVETQNCMFGWIGFWSSAEFSRSKVSSGAFSKHPSRQLAVWPWYHSCALCWTFWHRNRRFLVTLVSLRQVFLPGHYACADFVPVHTHIRLKTLSSVLIWKGHDEKQTACNPEPKESSCLMSCSRWAVLPCCRKF